MIDRVVLLAERLRFDGIEVGTSDVIDAVAAIGVLDLMDLPTLRAGLRATLVKVPDPAHSFDRRFAETFLHRSSGETAVPHPAGAISSRDIGVDGLDPVPIDEHVLRALMNDDDVALAALAAQAVDLYGGTDGDGSERYLLHRVLRALDLSRMLSAAMQRLRRDGDLTDLELMLRRHELARLLQDFRRRLAEEIRLRLGERALPMDPGGRVPAEDRELLRLSKTEHDEVLRLLEPLLRRLAVRIGRRQKLRAAGRVDIRRTIRRSLQAGGVPVDVVHRRRHPHRPEVVVLCDVSGSVAEFAQFTFTMINALHARLRRVRSFAFVDGIAEVTDVLEGARYEVAVNRLVERKGVLGLDGHSDYGAAFNQFVRVYLPDAVGSGTTVVITGDARGNYRDGGSAALAQIADRARRVYWLNPEPAAEWGEDDSLIEEYRRSCTAIHEVRTVGQLAEFVTGLA